MSNYFFDKLYDFLHKPVRIYIDSGDITGMAGFLLRISDDYIEIMSLCSKKKYQYMPRTITAIPINKITAISCHDYRNLHIGECKSKTVDKCYVTNIERVPLLLIIVLFLKKYKFGEH